MASTTVYSTLPLAGMRLYDVSSTPMVKPGTKVFGSDGKVYIYGKASEAIGSTSTCKIGTNFSISDDSGSAGWTSNASGGAATGQHLWLKRTTLA